MGGFNNPVVGALNLIRRAIRSPNFQTGTAGWSIDQDGSAEFNDVTVRGTVDVVGDDGSAVRINTEAGGNAGITMQPPATPGADYHPGSIAAESNGLSKKTDLIITSPHETSGPALNAQIVLEGSDGTTPDPLIVLDAADVTTSGDLSILGMLAAGNIKTGRTTITVTANNVNTTAVISGLSLAGTTFDGFCCVQTTSPNTRFATPSGVSADGFTINLVQTSGTVPANISVSWIVWGR